jgi:hypothetical protein
VDLTLENSQEQDTSTPIFSPPHLLKKTHKIHRKNFGTKNQQTLTKKSVQWKDSVNTNTISLKNQIKTTQKKNHLQPLHIRSERSTCAFFPTAATAPLHNLWSTWTKPIPSPIATQWDNSSLQSFPIPKSYSSQLPKRLIKSIKFPKCTTEHTKSIHQDSHTKQHPLLQSLCSSPQRQEILKPKKVKKVKKVSRRLVQRRNKRIATNKKTPPKNRYLHTLLQWTKESCLQTFGFIANPNLSLQKNFNITIQTVPSHLFLQPKNLTFPNFCKDFTLPTGSKELLGLNLKFCLATKHIL